jgi:hypothetical protein
LTGKLTKNDEQKDASGCGRWMGIYIYVEINELFLNNSGNRLKPVHSHMLSTLFQLVINIELSTLHLFQG